MRLTDWLAVWLPAWLTDIEEDSGPLSIEFESVEDEERIVEGVKETRDLVLSIDQWADLKNVDGLSVDQGSRREEEDPEQGARAHGHHGGQSQAAAGLGLKQREREGKSPSRIIAELL